MLQLVVSGSGFEIFTCTGMRDAIRADRFTVIALPSTRDLGSVVIHTTTRHSQFSHTRYRFPTQTENEVTELNERCLCNIAE